MDEKRIRKIAGLAVEAMLFEVSATPKPGLVDRENCGAHKDMDFFTFMSSSAALHSSFDSMVRAGSELKDAPVKKLLTKLRECGIQAEKDMFAFTRGVNTHKGMIFTLGMLCGCAGWYEGKGKITADILCSLVSEMCEGMCEKEFADLKEKKSLTKGESVYLKYGYTGVRGEVEGGYQTVRKISLPLYRKLKKEGHCQNDALIHTLIALIANTTDTNIISRHDLNTALYAKKAATEVLETGGIYSPEGKLGIINLDRAFIGRYISPGGCADLLAVTHFLYKIEKDEE